MKVLQINSVCGYGSTGRIVVDIHNELQKNGADSYIAYGRKQCKLTENIIKIGMNFNFIKHLLLTTLFDLHGFGSKKETLKLINIIKEINPDVIHLHNIHGYYINIEALFNYFKYNNKKIVWTLHDCWSFTGHCAYFDYVDCNRWQHGCYKCPEQRVYPISLGLDNSKNNYRKKKALFTNVASMTLVTPSRWLKELVGKSFLSNYPIQVINNGVNLALFKTVDNNLRAKYSIGDKFVILGVANGWNRRKGLKYFKQLNKYLNKDEVIILVGVNKFQKLCLSKKIISIKKTKDVNELIAIYSLANVFVNTTLEDNFPTTNIEALACGLPIVTFASGGSGEVIDDSVGYTVEKGNIKQLLDRIRLIKGKAIDYKYTCRLKAETKYDKADRIKDYLALYEKLVTES